MNERIEKQQPKKETSRIRYGYRDWLVEIGVYLLFVLILYLFYKSVYAFVLMVPGVIFYHRYHRKEVEQKYRETLNSQFKDALLSLSSALRAGYSMENAVGECLEEMQRMYGVQSPVYKELRIVKNQLALGIPLESAFHDFAERSGTEDIQTFAAVFSIAKRTGGDLVEIIQKTSSDIASKIDTRGEIAVVIRSRKLEQNIMALMPPLIILYIDLSAGSILAPLYENLLGRVVMTVCLAVYVGAYFLSRKIMNIAV